MRNGRKFGFVRFRKGTNVGIMERKLNGIWIGTFKLRVFAAERNKNSGVLGKGEAKEQPKQQKVIGAWEKDEKIQSNLETSLIGYVEFVDNFEALYTLCKSELMEVKDVKYLGLEEVEACSDEEEESLVPSEWSEGDENEEDWGVDESIFEIGQNEDNSDRKIEREDKEVTTTGWKSGKGDNQSVPAMGTERETQQSQVERGEAKENFEESGGSSKVHTDNKGAKNKETTRDEILDEDQNPESKRKQIVGEGVVEESGPKESSGFPIEDRLIQNKKHARSKKSDRVESFKEPRDDEVDIGISTRNIEKK
ncbi:hypothetical protein L6452_03237 [Arctium lappa]|uniref:Uncharacterized protein n=1 Tax=Arctium lappa TaxID=4217 RepID=A0ACB9FM91_ARCLA|nr:hypothetical protein L6452_03237 [Arctium lappa]